MCKSYSRSITREHRTAFILLLDRSGSMREKVVFDGREVTKACAVAETANRFLFELTERARRNDSVRDYYDIAVLSYSGDSVEPLLSDDMTFVTVSELARRRVGQSVWSREHRLPDGSHRIVATSTPRHIEPHAEGRAEVEYAGRMGLVDKSGKYVIAPEWEYLEYRDDCGISLVLSDGMWSAIDYEGHPTGIRCAAVADVCRLLRERMNIVVEP